MADNGKIIRNGAEIQIDENGNVVARPAAGQDFIVEDDAVVGSLEADTANISDMIQWRFIGQSTTTNDDLLQVDISNEDYDYYRVVWLVRTQGGDSFVNLTVDGDNANVGNGNYGYIGISGAIKSGEDAILLVDHGSTAARISSGVTDIYPKGGFSRVGARSPNELSSWTDAAEQLALPSPSESIEIDFNGGVGPTVRFMRVYGGDL